MNARPLPWILLLCAACAGAPSGEPAASRGKGPEPATTPAATPAERAAATPAPGRAADAPWEGGVAGLSNDGRYTVVYRPNAGPIERGETFGLDVWVLDAGGERPLDDVELSADAAMPQHGHGMNRVPEVRAEGGGRFAVDGMLFHMVGRWELYLDVTRGALTERAQFEVMLE